jgi:hypothetical protein
MKRIFFSIAILAIILIGTISFTNLRSTTSNSLVTIMETTVPPIPTLNPELVASGKQLYNQYCASCHGVNMEGKPNWKVSQPDGSLPPPPHDSSGHTWHHPDSVLIEITTNGGDPTLYNTKMPGFGDQLTQTEIEAVLETIKSNWGSEEREYQWWLTARED